MRSISDLTSLPQRPSFRSPRSSQELGHLPLKMRILFSARGLPAFACHNPHVPPIGSEEVEYRSKGFELSRPPTHSESAYGEYAPPCSLESAVGPLHPTAPSFPS